LTALRANATSSPDAARARVRIEREGDVAIWTIDRPEVRNAFDFATFAALSAAITRAKGDATLRAVVLTGAGSAFISGGDLRELRSATSRADAGRVADSGRRVCDGLAALRVPVIAALPGPAIGGGAEIALACDLRVAEPRAKLSFKHARMGVTTAWGVLPKLTAMVGPGMAARLLLTGHDVDAHEALRIGLVEGVCDEGACVATALAWAREASKGSPGAIGSLKALLRDAVEAPHPRRRAAERARFVAAWAGPDHHEAVEAFFEGRPPAWGAAKPTSRRSRRSSEPAR
jgi:enoyl-CoA hydratase